MRKCEKGHKTFAIYLNISTSEKNHLMRASKPFRHICRVFQSVGVPTASFFFIAIFKFCEILEVMKTRLLRGSYGVAVYTTSPAAAANGSSNYNCSNYNCWDEMSVFEGDSFLFLRGGESLGSVCAANSARILHIWRPLIGWGLMCCVRPPPPGSCQQPDASRRLAGQSSAQHDPHFLQA